MKNEEYILPPDRMAPLREEADQLVAIFASISKRARGD